MIKLSLLSSQCRENIVRATNKQVIILTDNAAIIIIFYLCFFFVYLLLLSNKEARFFIRPQELNPSTRRLTLVTQKCFVARDGIISYWLGETVGQ
jgi:hypothetical protein